MDVVDAINNSPNGYVLVPLRIYPHRMVYKSLVATTNSTTHDVCSPQEASACIVERLQYAGERVQSYALTVCDIAVFSSSPSGQYILPILIPTAVSCCALLAVLERPKYCIRRCVTLPSVLDSCWKRASRIAARVSMR
jgi:hypothetical protein